MAKKEKPKTIVSPVGEAKFAWLTRPDTQFVKDGVYRTELLLTPEESAELIEAIDAAIEAHKEKVVAELKKKGKKGKALDIKMSDKPYKDDEDADGNETGKISFRFKMKAKVTKDDGTVIEMKPAVFDAKNKPMSGVPVYSGSKIQVAYQMFPFFTAMAGCGVSLRLKAVRVIELTSADRSGESYFGAEADGYEYDNEQATVAADNDTSPEDDGQPPEF